jgi:hypothetical protein
MVGDVVSIDEGGKLLLMLDNDSIIELRNSKYQISCTGCGATGLVGSSAPGLFINFYLTKDNLSSLITHKVKKVRIYFTDGYKEAEIKDKFAIVFQDQAKMIF